MTADFDVVVVGGGPAGIAAALSSARRGAHTLLLERGERLGGNAANAFVHTICGLYEPPERGDRVPLHPGLPRRLAERLCAVGAASAADRIGRVFVLPLDPMGFGAHVSALCREIPSLEVSTRSELIGASFESDEGVRLQIDGGPEAGPGSGRSVSAAFVVDTTGDATVASLAGLATLETDASRLQLPSFIFRLSGVDNGALAGFAKLRVTHALASAARDGAIPSQCESVLIRPVAGRDQAYVTLNVPRPTRYRPLDPQQLAALTERARSDASQIAQFLRETRPAFADSRIDAWPSRLGVRETRRVAGHYEMTRDDVLRGRADPDEVCRSSWPIELWTDHRRATFEYPEGPCSIPLGALVSRGSSRLGMAGRCLSASPEASGALRVIGTALATGEAIGVAAALAADRSCGLDAIAAADVRDHIVEPGADAGAGGI